MSGEVNPRGAGAGSAVVPAAADDSGGGEGAGSGEREWRLGVRDVSEQCAREQTEG